MTHNKLKTIEKNIKILFNHKKLGQSIIDSDQELVNSYVKVFGGEVQFESITRIGRLLRSPHKGCVKNFCLNPAKGGCYVRSVQSSEAALRREDQIKAYVRT